MHELRLVAVSEDGSYAVLVVPGRSGRFSLPIDDRLRAVARGQFSRLAQYEIEVESPLRPKEIQERIRAGETADEIADAAGVPIERVRWFEGPVLAERAYRAQEAQAAMVRRPGDPGPGPRLGEVVTERLGALGASAEDAHWDSTKRGDGSWQVQLVFSSGGRARTAEWIYDPRRRHATPVNDGAAMLSLPEADLPPETGQRRGEATVTPLQPRFGTAPGPAGRPGRRVAEAPVRTTEVVPPPGRAPDDGPAAGPDLPQQPAAEEDESRRDADRAQAGCSLVGTSTTFSGDAPVTITVTSPLLIKGVIPARYTCHGAGKSPPLHWSGAPPGTKTLALVVDDADAPITPYIYWIVFDINPTTTDIQAGQLPPGARQAENSAGNARYEPPCPHNREHTYRFTVYALRSVLSLPDRAGMRAAWAAIAPA